MTDNTERATPKTNQAVSAWLNNGDPFGPSTTARNPVVTLCESFERENASLRAQVARITTWSNIEDERRRDRNITG